MNKAYWLDRKRAALASARAAETSEARLFHYDMAGRHSVRAVHALAVPPAAPGPGDGA